MMRTMRGLAKWIMGIVAVAFVGFMIFQVGMDASGRGSSQGQAIARVNGRAIDYNTFQTAIRGEYDRIRSQGSPAPLTLEGQRQLEDQVLEQLIQQVLLEQEYRRRGISVTDAEVVAAARTSPPPEVYNLEIFQTDSQFDITKYQRYLASNADPAFLVALEARYREEIPRVKLIQQVTAGVFVSDAELWSRWRDQHDSVTAEVLALFPPAVIADSAVTLTDAEVRSWYDAHRTDFSRPARAFMSFVAVPRRPNATDSMAAATRAREIHAEVAGGGDFAEIARRVSSDSVSGAQGGDLGEQRRGAFVPAFETATLALRPGQVSQPVESQFGWHIIRLESRTDSTFHAAHVLIPIEPTGDHLDEIERRGDSLDLFAAEQDDGGALDRIAEALGVPVGTAPPVTEGERLELGRFALGDPPVWAFGPEAVVGGTSPVIEADWAYYVFRLDSLQAAGVPPFEAVMSGVWEAAALDRKRTLTRQVAQDIVTRARDAGSLLAAGSGMPSAPTTVGPFTRVSPPPILQTAVGAVGVAFGLGVGQVSEPVTSDVAIYVLRTIRKVQADSTAWLAQLESQRTEAIRQARQARLQAVFASLRTTARVEDYREELARRAREAEAQGLLPGNPLGF